MTGFGDDPDRNKTGDVGEDLVDSSTGAPSKSKAERLSDPERSESDRMRLFADDLIGGEIKRWLNEYADLLDRGVGLVTMDVDERGQVRLGDRPDNVISDMVEIVNDLWSDKLDNQIKADRRESHSEEMMVRSGNIHDPRPVVAFLYYLARDELPVGDIEAILIRLRELESDFGEYGFTNGWVARWAQDAAERLGVTRSSAFEKRDT